MPTPVRSDLVVPRSLGVVVIVCILAVSLLADTHTRTAVDRTVYCTATDARGAYIDDLTPADVLVKEGGRERQILRVEPLRERLKVSLAIDEGLSPADEVRRAAADLVDRLRDVADVALYRVGSGTVKIVDFSADPQLLRRAINAMPYKPQGGGNLVESLYQIVGDTRSAEGRRVVIILTTEIAQRSSMAANGVLDQLRDTGTVMHATTLVGPAGPLEPPTPEMAHLENVDEIERDRLLNEGPKQSGGLRLSLLRTEALPGALDRIRGELLHQWTVTYTLPAGSKSDGQLTLSTKRKGVTIRGPRQVSKISS